MKITKSSLKQIIKEELNRMEEEKLDPSAAAMRTIGAVGFMLGGVNGDQGVIGDLKRIKGTEAAIQRLQEALKALQNPVKYGNELSGA